MKLVTYSWKGNVALGAVSNDRVVDLRRAHAAALRRQEDTDELAVADLRVPGDLLGLLRGGGASLAAAQRALAFVEELRETPEASDLWHPLADVQLLPPILRPGKVVCVGLNYRSHLAEIGDPVPQYPILFHKAATSLVGHRQAIVLPRISREVDFEGELAVVIGRRGKHIAERDALSHVAGYTCANDVSANDLEFRTSQWTSGKMLDTFCPLGPVLLTRDSVRDPGLLRLKTTLNGQTMQQACTSDMVFSVPFLISYVSALATLEPGDLLLTGTPAGIGCNRKPPVFLKPGDEVSVQIEGIGTLTNRTVAEGEDE
jgi:2-keto-4-pentenoate hydratase/2-oxohepta-3-ene-1,7-dioic acid hydratase in catechol pathway